MMFECPSHRERGTPRVLEHGRTEFRVPPVHADPTPGPPPLRPGSGPDLIATEDRSEDRGHHPARRAQPARQFAAVVQQGRRQYRTLRGRTQLLFDPPGDRCGVSTVGARHTTPDLEFGRLEVLGHPCSFADRGPTGTKTPEEPGDQMTGMRHRHRSGLMLDAAPRLGHLRQTVIVECLAADMAGAVGPVVES